MWLAGLTLSRNYKSISINDIDDRVVFDNKLKPMRLKSNKKEGRLAYCYYFDGKLLFAAEHEFDISEKKINTFLESLDKIPIKITDYINPYVVIDHQKLAWKWFELADNVYDRDLAVKFNRITDYIKYDKIAEYYEPSETIDGVPIIITDPPRFIYHHKYNDNPYTKNGKIRTTLYELMKKSGKWISFKPLFREQFRRIYLLHAFAQLYPDIKLYIERKEVVLRDVPKNIFTFFDI